MSTALKGKPAADQIKEQLTAEVARFKKKGIYPKIGILRVGDREDDLAYEQRVLKNCTEIGIAAQVAAMPKEISQEDFLATLYNMNRDRDVHGILIFRPLPDQLDGLEISAAIDPGKDIDSMSPVNAGKIFLGEEDGIPPCTPEAVLEILDYYGYELSGKHVVIVNRSMVLGKPLAMLFLKKNATVTICHSKTKDLSEFTKNADIVVTGVGKARFFGRHYFNENSVVVDVGINFEDNKLYGDVDYDQVSELVSAITPVPGGVGSVTSMILLRHIMHGIRKIHAK